VLSDPRRYLGVQGEAQGALVSQVGQAVLGLVLDAPDLGLDRVFGREGLEKVIKSALAVVGEHPEILAESRNLGLRVLLSEIAKDLSQYDRLLVLEMLPELARLILDKTGENLPLLWPDFASRPQHNLLLVAMKTTLDIVSRPPAAGEKWQPRFSRSDLLKLTETVLDELVSNPGWLLDQAGQLNQNLETALTASLEVLRAKADGRLSPSVWMEVLRAAVKAVASRQEFLNKLPAGTAPEGQRVVAAVLDGILSQMLGEQKAMAAAWQLVRAEAVMGVTKVALDLLAKSGLDAGCLGKLKDVLSRHVGLVTRGKPLDLHAFEADLRTALGLA
jgi:hypothetical protein